MKILIIDNYDSFTYNLVHLTEQFADEVLVVRNDEVDFSIIDQYDKIILSPGPGLPEDAGNLKDVVKEFAFQFLSLKHDEIWLFIVSYN